MTREQFDSEKNYQAALAIARAMLEQGVITGEDYDKTEEVLRGKFHPLIGAFQPAA